jgi:AcrR family transcriptional regulator
MASRPSTPGSTSSRERLLRAAKHLFAAGGYEHTATSAIARAAGTSESQLMRYFGGKVGLLDAVFDAAWVDLNRRIDRATARPEAPPDTLLRIIETVTGVLARDPDLATLFLFEARRIRGGGPGVRLSSGFTAFNDRVKAIVKSGVASGAFRSGLDAAAVTAGVLGAAESMARERLMMRRRGGRAFGEREIRRTLDAMVAGLSGEAAPQRRHAAAGRVRTSDAS